MQIIITSDYEAMSNEAAGIVLAAVREKPELVLGLAAGNTPIGLYKKLWVRSDWFSKVRFFNLDEFFGASPGSKHSFHRMLKETLLDKVKHHPDNVRFLRGDVEDLETEADKYEEAIKAAGGIDLQILGIGMNGHLGFNEPGSSLGSRTRPKTLEPDTLASFVETLDSEAPMSSFAITMGIGTIMEAGRLLLIASGEKKAEMVQQMVEGPITSEVPASAMQMHPHAIAVLDEGAASKLRRKDYWKWVHENRWRVQRRS